VFKTKTKTLHLKTKTKTFLWCIPEADRKAFFTFGRKRKCWRILFTAENATKTKIHFQPKNENESHLIILVFFPFHTFSHQVNPTMRRQYLVQFRLFCRWSLLTGISSCTVYRYLCGIFLDISIREQFAFLVYYYWVKAVFHKSMHCALLASVWPNK